MTHSELKAMPLEELRAWALKFFSIDMLLERELCWNIPADADDSHEYLQETIATHLELED